MSKFDGSASVMGAAFKVGRGIRKMTLTKEYGFTATTLALEFDPAELLDRLPTILQREAKDRVPVKAMMHFKDDGTESYSGFLDDNAGQLTRAVVKQDSIILTSRSILGLLIDDDARDPNNRLTQSWYNADWADAVSDVVRRRRLDPLLVKPANLKAKDSLDSPVPLLSVQNALPSEIVSKAIDQTGFVANVLADGSFYFAKRPPEVAPGIVTTLQFRRGGEIGIALATFANNKIANVTLDEDVEKLEPGSQIRIMVVGEGALDDSLSGEFFVVKSTYVDAVKDVEAFAQFDLLPELPGLGGKS